MAGRGNRNDPPLLPEGEPLVPPTTEVIADLTGDDTGPSSVPFGDSDGGTAGGGPAGPSSEPVVAEPEAAREVEPVAAPVEEPAAEPEPDPDAVTFVCDQWAGVSVFGKGIKFENHLFTTSDPRKIAVLDAWEHARREG